MRGAAVAGGTAPATTGSRVPGESFRLGQRPALDGLRGVSVLLVVAFHATGFLVPQFFGRFVPGGFIGVDSFFVLSGFLITSLLLEEQARAGRISFRGFYGRRARRLLPALIVMLAGFVVYTVMQGDPMGPWWPAIGLIALFGANLAPLFGVLLPFDLDATWTLGIEEQFYLFWPAVLVVFCRLRRRILAVLLVLAVFGVALASLVAFQLHPANNGFIEREARLNGLLVGAAIGYALHHGWRAPRWVRLAAVPAVALVAATVVTTTTTASWLIDGGFTAIDIAIGVIILAVIDGRGILARLLSCPPLRYCGLVSYAAYLWHMLIFIAVARALPAHSTAERLVLGFGILALVSVTSRYLVELPFTKRRRSPVPRVSSRAVPGSVSVTG